MAVYSVADRPCDSCVVEENVTSRTSATKSSSSFNYHAVSILIYLVELLKFDVYNSIFLFEMRKTDDANTDWFWTVNQPP